jgi:hypothetical protein
MIAPAALRKPAALLFKQASVLCAPNDVPAPVSASIAAAQFGHVRRNCAAIVRNRTSSRVLCNQASAALFAASGASAPLAPAAAYAAAAQLSGTSSRKK